MPLLDANASPQSLAVANGALLIALLDFLVARGICDQSEVQELVRTAIGIVGNRARTPEGIQALGVLDALWSHFCAH